MAATEKTCDLCGGKTFETICNRDRKGNPWNTVACCGCGLVGHEKVPTEEELEAYYANSYRQEYHGETVPSPRRVWRAWRQGERLLRQLRPCLHAGASVFEVGAGLGCTVKAFEQAGFDASGMEPGTSFQHYSATQLKTRLHHATLFSWESVQKYDLVLLIHVIEHFRSPRRALQAIHKLIQPGGRLYLECPSLGSVCRNLAEQFHFAHIHTFTPSTLKTLLRQCGFVEERCFGDGHGRNFGLLLRRVEPQPDAFDPTSRAQTKEFIARYQRPWHRFSFDYLCRRFRRIRQYFNEYTLGDRAVQRILASCV